MSSPARVLILFAHPALQRSRVNCPLLAAVRDLEGVTVNDLYEEYPDYLIDADREQAMLRAHDLIVFHHPFYWYSSPAILKEWQDIVLEHGFAYGDSGTELRGKRWLSVITTGGPQEKHHPKGLNRFSVRQLLSPFEQTAQLCGMTFLEPFIVHGSHALAKAEIATHAAAYRRLLAALRDGQSREEASPLSDA